MYISFLVVNEYSEKSLMFEGGYWLKYIFKKTVLGQEAKTGSTASGAKDSREMKMPLNFFIVCDREFSLLVVQYQIKLLVLEDYTELSSF